MSQENVEVVQASLNAWNAGDMDAHCALYDPNVIWARLEGWPEAETLIGLEACRSQWERMRAVFDADTVEPIGDPVASGDRVVQRFLWRGTGQGPEMKMELTAVFTLRKGKIFILEHFWDHAEALEAVGLQE
jgi:ketosteroid isomerase-like protein